VRGQEKVALGFTSGNACRVAKPSRNERSQIRRFETMLKEERIIVEDEFFMHVMEADSFNDTIKEVEVVVDLGCPHDQQMKHLLKLIELLKEKVAMGILEPSNAPYSNRWFTVPKKNGSLQFIQDLQPVNKVTI
jgi:predicted aconitase